MAFFARTRIGIAGLAAAVATGAAAQAPEQQLAPHRAIYELSLARVEPSVSILSVTGQLVYELSGSWCEGYTVTSSFQTNTVDREGELSRTDLRTSAYETLNPAEYRFLNQTFVEGEADTVIDGVARVTASGTSVELMKPREARQEFARAMFPTQHTHLILEAAAAGERVLEAPLFDGGGTADTVFDTTTVIGSAETGLPTATPREAKALAELKDTTTHAVSISYFEQGGPSGEGVPDYVISFRMLDNGISYNAVFDYNAFVLHGRLVELEVLPVPECTEGGGSQ